MQEAVRTALAAAAPDAVPEAVRRNWEISVTEREVRMGLTHQDDTEIHALVLMRTVEGLKEGVDKGDDKAGLYYTAPDMDRRLLNELRGLVKDGLDWDGLDHCRGRRLVGSHADPGRTRRGGHQGGEQPYGSAHGLGLQRGCHDQILQGAGRPISRQRHFHRHPPDRFHRIFRKLRRPLA
jgi:hypothetical protein